MYQYFIRRKHNNVEFYYQSQSYFDLPKRTIRNNSKKILLFHQILKDNENIYRHFGGYDMSYDNFNHLCRKTWTEKYNYLSIDKSKKNRSWKIL